MDYLKFNCFDLVAQNDGLTRIHRQMADLSIELVGILDALDPQIKSYESIQNGMKAVKTAMADISAHILNEYNALDQIIDTYYAAENKVIDSVEALPAGIGIVRQASAVFGKDDLNMPVFSTSSINNEDLILEDWLLELVYRQSDSKNKD